MTIQGNGSSSTGSSTPSTYSYSESYMVNYVSASTYKVTITEAEAGQNLVATTWILKNGTAIAIDIAGENLTGSEASGMSVGLFSGFILQIQEDAQISLYTGQSFFHSTGTSTVTIGSTSVKVTNYAANTLPETISSCGTNTTLTAYSFAVGTPQGAGAPLVTYEHFAGSDIVNGQTTTFSYYSQVTAITVA
jgi:hypothetical protein